VIILYPVHAHHVCCTNSDYFIAQGLIASAREFNDGQRCGKLVAAHGVSAALYRQPRPASANCLDRGEGAKKLETVKRIREAFGIQRGIRIANVEMQMRPGRLPCVTQQTKYLTASEVIARFDPDAPRLEMCVERIPAVPEIQRYVVTTVIF
jgi:hypothetical protein